MIIVSKKKININKLFKYLEGYGIICEENNLNEINIMLNFGIYKNLNNNIKDKFLNELAESDKLSSKIPDASKVWLWIGSFDKQPYMKGNDIYFDKKYPFSFPDSFTDESKNGCALSVQNSEGSWLNINYDDVNQLEYINKFFSTLLKLTDYFDAESDNNLNFDIENDLSNLDNDSNIYIYEAYINWWIIKSRKLKNSEHYKNYKEDLFNIKYESEKDCWLFELNIGSEGYKNNIIYNTEFKTKQEFLNALMVSIELTENSPYNEELEELEYVYDLCK